jgi:hypothetical protein
MGSNRQQARHSIRNCGRNSAALSRVRKLPEDSAKEMRSIALPIHPPFMSLNAD